MSIEVLNESGDPVDEATLSALAAHVLDGHERASAGGAVDRHGRRGGDDRAAREVDGRARARPTCWPSRWTSCAPGTCPAAPRTPRSIRRCSATSCCARPWRRRQAKEAGHATEDELHLLCTHGILHLLGYDHAEPEEHKEMFGLQAELLASWRRAARSPRHDHDDLADHPGRGAGRGRRVCSPAPRRRWPGSPGYGSTSSSARSGRRGAQARRGRRRPAALPQPPAAAPGELRAGRHGDRRGGLHDLRWVTSWRAYATAAAAHDRGELRRGRRDAAHARPPARRPGGAGRRRDDPSAGARARPAAASCSSCSATRSRPARASVRGRSPPRPSCATSSTSPSSGG